MTGIQYVKAYRAGARQLATIAYGARFFRMGISLVDAIDFADMGYTPDEVAEMGYSTPAQAREIEDGEAFLLILERL
jgi:hypothetical protein